MVSSRANLPDGSQLRIFRYALLAWIAAQFVGTCRYLPQYFELVRTGALPLGYPLLQVVASLSLYAAAILAGIRPSRGKALFLAAAVGLGLWTVVWIAWGGPSLRAEFWPWTFLPALGALLGACGWWLAVLTRRSAG